MSRREELTVGQLVVEGAKNQAGVSVLFKDGNGNALISSGTAVPNAVVGYAKGGLFIKTDAANGVKALYENQGTTASCSFDLVGAIGAVEITLANGKILVGDANGVAAAVTMSGDVTITNAGVATIGAGKVTKTKIGYTAVAVTVNAAQAAGSSAADPNLVNGEIFGVYPTGNQDQFIDNAVLNGDGSVTVTLAAAATANNTFKVLVVKP